MDLAAIQIDYLINHQRFLPVLTDLMYHHWQPLLEALGKSRPDFELSMQERCHTDSLPLALVAFERDHVFGTIALKPQDLDIRPQLTPWLGGLFVLPEYRGCGVASLLIPCMVKEAARLHLSDLYLWTPSAESLYARHGWVLMEKTPYHTYEISIMHRRLAAVL
jgi:GNAT superfamily N-acetyltransferase